jgi:hypothetical protein
MTRRMAKRGRLKGVRVYLSGPMDFVASRADEKKTGWRNRVGEFLRSFGATVFDPWNKPRVRGFHQYGAEDETSTATTRRGWTFEDGRRGAEARACASGQFWETMHIDLRMVDTSDFVIAYCPTNIYSVGTPHEIVLARQQRKPVLFVSPKVVFPSLERLRKHLAEDPEGAKMLEALATEVPIKENPDGIPSAWYMPLVGGESFFDGFGFAKYRRRFGWERIALDDRESRREIRRPLLPFLEQADRSLPKRWDNRLKRYTRNDDWLLWDLKPKEGGYEVEEPR